MKRTFPFINTPPAAFAIVIGPISAFMCMLLLLPHQSWIRGSAAMVLGISFYAFARGYVRRLRIEPEGVRFCSLGGARFLSWNEVRRIDRYVPGGSLNGPRYVYVTKLDRPPAGLYEQDSQTFQLQDRPGLLESLTAQWTAARAAHPV